tara:strand:- start:71 stop:385 length:315 start_codon:yes stop_codon:yes gene_type:complete
MNNGKLSKTDIENNFIQILEKYPESIENTVSVCFDLVLDCLVVIYGEKKAIKLLDESKKSIRRAITLKMQLNLEKHLKGVKNSAKTQDFDGKRKNCIQSKTQSV